MRNSEAGIRFHQFSYEHPGAIAIMLTRRHAPQSSLITVAMNGKNDERESSRQSSVFANEERKGAICLGTLPEA
jgi:hypothetical protein